MDLQLAGKRAIVTGGSRGIGRAVAVALAREGTHIALVGRDKAALAAAAVAVTEAGTAEPGRVLTQVADTTDDAAVRRMVDVVVAELGGVDVLVNAAAPPAVGPAPRWAELTDDEMRHQFETKVLGYLRCARAAAPHMIAHGWGRIINISGLNARQASSIVGSIRNAGVVALTKNLADELGPHGIGVTVVHPGITVTERSPSLFAEMAKRDGTTLDQVTARLGSLTSLGRLITASELADVVVFLCSPRSVAITGDAIAAGGGARGAIYY